jgi:hypothetical protein
VPRKPKLRTLATVVTFLEMTADAQIRAAPPVNMKLALMRAESPPLHFYRYLYEVIGQDYHWIDRKDIPDRALAEMIQHPMCRCISPMSPAWPLFSSSTVAVGGWSRLGFRPFRLLLATRPWQNGCVEAIATPGRSRPAPDRRTCTRCPKGAEFVSALPRALCARRTHHEVPYA